MATISGEQMTWHKITVDFEAPQDFSEEASTFRDYRLDVTFTNTDTGEVVTIPGFFAADGDAANTNATSGNVWRANFNPPSEGNWEYEASFRTGVDIAATTFESDPDAGEAVAFIDGERGSITVTETDKTGDDFRAKGMIVQDEGTHYLQHQGDGDYFIRGGPGIPENFLASTDFDNTENGRHDYATHLDDFNVGDPTWDGGKGEAIIGATNYLAEQGLNTIYLLTNTSGGDGRDVSPWTFDASETDQHDNGLTDTEIDKFSIYDVSKLAQWDIVFDHMDENGIYKNVLLQETENDQLLNNGTEVDGSSLSVERLVYIREMIARFGHNNGIQWNIGEENTNTDEERADQAEYLKSVDAYDHLVVVHSFPGDIEEVYDPLLDDEAFDGTSFQTSAQDIRNQTIEFRDKSAEAGDPWVLAWDEDSSGNGVIDSYSNDPDSENEIVLREGFWGSLTAGGSGGNWYFRGSSGHSFDQNYDTFDAHASVWTWTSAATSFFNTYIPFWDMQQADGLTSDGDDFVMAQEGEYYVVYAPYGEATDISLDLSDQSGETFDVLWYNPREGGDLIEAGQVSGGNVANISNPPSEINKDWVLLVRNVDAAEFPQASAGDTMHEPVVESDAFQGENGTIVIEAESTEIQGYWRETIVDGETVLLWDAPSSNYSVVDPDEELSYSFVADEGGTYHIAMHSARVKSTMGNSELFEADGTARTDTGNDAYVAIFDVEAGEYLQEPTKLFTGLGGTDETLRFGTTFDAESHFPATVGLEAGKEYRLEITGRSDGYALDKITINKGDFLRDANAVESPTVGTTAPTEPTPTPNEAPVALDDMASTQQDTTILVDVLANDRDPDGNSLTLTGVSYDGDTSVVTIVDGQISVNPLNAATNDRTEVITYTVTDSDGATDTATLRVEISGGNTMPTPTPPANAAPVANDDTASTAHDTTILVDVLANDSDSEGSVLTITNVSYDGDTALVTVVDGQISVNPLNAATDARTETISYTVADEDGATNTATLSVDVAGAVVEPEPEPALDVVLTAVNADSDTILSNIENGGTLTVEDLSAGLNFAATVDGDVGSMLFSLDGGETQIENLPPYAAFGNNGTDFNGQSLPAGEHALSIEIYSEANGGGTLLSEQVITFTVTEQAPEPESILDVFIADATSNDTIISLSDGDVIDADSLGENFTFYATTDVDDQVDRVTLTFDGTTSTELVTPYALFGDIEGDFRDGLDLEAGTYDLEISAFGHDNTLLETTTLNFEIA